MNRCIIVVIILLSFSCSEPKKATLQKTTPAEKAKIESFSHKLVNSFNQFDFSVINESWNNERFKDRVLKHVNKTQQSVFNHVFDKELRMTIKTGNLSIVHRLNTDQGKVSILRIDHFNHHSELILVMMFEGTYDFFKYRIESTQSLVNLTDFYRYTDNLWYSEKVINMLQLNAKYDAFSSERHKANQAIEASEQALQHGDISAALHSLNQIPQTHQKGNWLSLKKINLAVFLGDSVLNQVMSTEYKNNKSLYMKYLYNYYLKDTSSLNSTYKLLSEELGESRVLDSLINSQSSWNKIDL